MKKVIISGASGQDGSYMIDHLLKLLIMKSLGA